MQRLEHLLNKVQLLRIGGNAQWGNLTYPSAVTSNSQGVYRRLARRGMEFHSIEDTLRSTVDSAIELGFVTPKGKVDHTLMRWNDRLQPLLVGAGKL